MKETFRFYYEYEFFQYRKSACETSVILAGKRGSRRRFTTSFCENGVVAKTRPRNVSDLVFFCFLFLWNHERANLSSFKTTASSSSLTRVNEASWDSLSRSSSLKTVKSNLESKGLL